MGQQGEEKPRWDRGSLWVAVVETEVEREDLCFAGDELLRFRFLHKASPVVRGDLVPFVGGAKNVRGRDFASRLDVEVVCLSSDVALVDSDDMGKIVSLVDARDVGFVVVGYADAWVEFEDAHEARFLIFVFKEQHRDSGCRPAHH